MKIYTDVEVKGEINNKLKSADGIIINDKNNNIYNDTFLSIARDISKNNENTQAHIKWFTYNETYDELTATKKALIGYSDKYGLGIRSNGKIMFKANATISGDEAWDTVDSGNIIIENGEIKTNTVTSSFIKLTRSGWNNNYQYSFLELNSSDETKVSLIDWKHNDNLKVRIGYNSNAKAFTLLCPETIYLGGNTNSTENAVKIKGGTIYPKSIYASADTTKGTIEERLTRLGFRSGVITFSNGSYGSDKNTDTASNGIFRQGNYVFGKISIQNKSEESLNEHKETFKNFMLNEIIISLPENFRPKNTFYTALTAINTDGSTKSILIEMTSDGKGKIIYITTSHYYDEDINSTWHLNFGFEAPPIT